MKRNSLTTALIAGLAGAAGLASTASALNLNPDGLGQVLIYPYYTVNKGNSTLLSVVNTTNRVKAVKVRFLEGRNSKEVLDFNLYLSPYDVWTASIDANGATGPGILGTSDTSCTVPMIYGDAALLTSGTHLGANAFYSVPFVEYAYYNNNPVNPTQDWDDAGTAPSLAALLQSLERTRTGHIEMIEMGNLQSGSIATQLAEEATHTAATGRPVNCQALVRSWISGNGGWADPIVVGGVTYAGGWRNIDVPSGGLFGAAAIVDVPNGTFHAYNAEALDGFYLNDTTPQLAGELHAFPGTIEPNLEDGDSGNGSINTYVFINNSASIIAEQFPIDVAAEDLTVQYSSTGSSNYGYGLDSLGNPSAASVDAVSTLFMHNYIYNEYVTEPSLGATSEWVITFPTKSFYVNYPAQPVGPGGADRYLARAPFTNSFIDDGASCDDIGIFYRDREENSPTAPPGVVNFSPPRPGTPTTVPGLCYEANVLTFNQATTAGTSSIFGHTYAHNIQAVSSGTSVYQNGWARIEFLGVSSTVPSVAGVGLGRRNVLYVDPSIQDGTGAPVYSRFIGLPVVGFWSVNYVNSSAAPGRLANFSGAFRHRASRDCQGTTAGYCDGAFGPTP